jgi:hypothetical protein
MSIGKRFFVTSWFGAAPGSVSGGRWDMGRFTSSSWTITVEAPWDLWTSTRPNIWMVSSREQLTSCDILFIYFGDLRCLATLIVQIHFCSFFWWVPIFHDLKCSRKRRNMTHSSFRFGCPTVFPRTARQFAPKGNFNCLAPWLRHMFTCLDHVTSSSS